MAVFKQQLSFWFYRNCPRGYRGFHLTGETKSCQWLITELGKKTLTKVDLALMRVTKNMLGVPNCPHEAIDFLYANFSFEKMLIQPISLTNIHPTLKITFNEVGRQSLIKGIRDIQDGRGDYCIGEDDNELWFWWLPSER